MIEFLEAVCWIIVGAACVAIVAVGVWLCWAAWKIKDDVDEK